MPCLPFSGVSAINLVHNLKVTPQQMPHMKARREWPQYCRATAQAISHRVIRDLRLSEVLRITYISLKRWQKNLRFMFN